MASRPAARQHEWSWTLITDKAAKNLWEDCYKPEGDLKMVNSYIFSSWWKEKRYQCINGRKYRRFRLNQQQKALSMSFMHGKNCLPLYYYQSNCVHLSASKWHWAHREKQREREGKTGTYKQRLESAVYQRDTGKTPKYHFLEAQKNEMQENNVYKS